METVKNGDTVRIDRTMANGRSFFWIGVISEIDETERGIEGFRLTGRNGGGDAADTYLAGAVNLARVGITQTIRRA
jgi:hypothetical protein